MVGSRELLGTVMNAASWFRGNFSDRIGDVTLAVITVAASSFSNLRRSWSIPRFHANKADCDLQDGR